MNQKTALISVSNKENILPLARHLIQNNYQILSTGPNMRMFLH
jgi:AICAR transformylase/IMP cyclohydrolase PurH